MATQFDQPMGWFGVVVLATLALGLLVTLFWVAKSSRNRAGYFWGASGVLLTCDGTVTLAQAPAFLVPYSTDLASPFAAYFAYRGALEFAETPPHRLALPVTLLATLSWLGFYWSNLPALRIAVGSGTAAIFLALASYHLLPVSRTMIQRLLCASWIVPIILLGLRPIAEFTGFSKADEVEIWLVALSGMGLLTICAMLERSTEQHAQDAEERAEQLRLGAVIGGVGTWTLDLTTGQTFWSDELYVIYGMPIGSPIPDSDGHLAFINKEDRDRLEKGIQTAIERRASLDIEFGIGNDPRNPRYARTRARYIMRPNGNPVLVGTTMEITEYRGAIEELRVYRSHLEDMVAKRTDQLATSQQRLLHAERLASIGTLTAGLAHQVNNPVGSILAAADFAMLCEDDRDELQVLRRAVLDIKSEASRCGEIVRDMLRFASDRPTEKKIIEIDALLDRVRQSLRRVERDSGASLSLHFESPGPRVNASAIEIEQAVTNLVENAFQSRNEGAVVSTERRIDGEFAVIAVKDNGRGIPDAELAHVTDPFFTSRLDSGGTGLGLSVVHGIVKEHGGELHITSEIAVGTTIEFTLPLA